MFKKIFLFVLLLLFCFVAFSTCSFAYTGELPDIVYPGDLLNSTTTFCSSVTFRSTDGVYYTVSGTGLSNNTDVTNLGSSTSYHQFNGDYVTIDSNNTTNRERVLTSYNLTSNSTFDYISVAYRGFYSTEYYQILTRGLPSSTNGTIRNSSCGVVYLPYRVILVEPDPDNENNNFVFVDTEFLPVYFRSYDNISDSSKKEFFTGSFNYSFYWGEDYIIRSIDSIGITDFINKLYVDINSIPLINENGTFLRAGTPYFFNCSTEIVNVADASPGYNLIYVGVDEGFNPISIDVESEVVDQEVINQTVVEEIDVNIFEWLFDAVQGVLDIQFFGSITFGHILLIVLAIPLLIGILKLVAGG